MGWLIFLGILILLCILPLGISAAYNVHGFFLRVIAGPFRITLLPTTKKNKKIDKKEPNKDQIAVKNAKPTKKQDSKTGGDLKDFIPFVKIALEFLDDFRRKLRVDCLEMKLILAGGDPCDLSLNYGKAWTALGNLMPQLERVFVIRKRDLEIECDYMSEKTIIYARIDLTITLGRLIYILLRHGGHALVAFIKMMKLRKGGAKQ